MADSEQPLDSHSTPDELQDATASEILANPSPPAEDSDLDMDHDSNDGGGSDNESELSDVDEAAFADFDPNSVAIADRPTAVIDEEITRGLKASKRKRTDGESKKKEAKRDRPKKKKRIEEDDDASGGDTLEGKRSRKPKRAATDSRTNEEKVRAQKQKEAIADENLTPEQRRARALDAVMDAALKNPNKRRRKKDEVVSFFLWLRNLTLCILTYI